MVKPIDLLKLDTWLALFLPEALSQNFWNGQIYKTAAETTRPSEHFAFVCQYVAPAVTS